MKLSKSASGILSARYRVVLIKCFLANLTLLPLPAAATTISSGTYGNEDFQRYDEDVTIEGGTFNNVQIDAPNITVTGGTFNGRVDLVASDTLTITGGIFNIPDSIWLDANKVSIDSDKVYLNVKWSKSPESLYPGEYPEIDANVLAISGSRGIFVEDTQINTLSISGKITAKGNSFLGNLTETNDVYKVNGKTLYSVVDFHSNKSNTSFSNSTIHLNGNSFAGSGYYILSGGIDANGNWDEDIISDVVMLRDKLTTAEINESISIVMADLKRANSRDDLMDVTRSTLTSISSFDYSIAWEDLDFTQIETDLRKKYADFNAKLSETGADVNISNSKFVLNDKAKLVNDSFKSGDMTITSSTVTVNGNNELSARSGKVQLVGSVLDVADNAVLTFSSADGALHLDGGSALSLSGKMTGGIAAETGATIAFQSSAARLNGTLSGTADVNFNADYALSNLSLADGFQFRNIVIDSFKTLDIGTSRLTAASISGGTISAVLTDAAKTTPIISANAKNVTLKLGMSAASNTETTLYHITQGTGFKLSNYLTTRYAVSSSYFKPEDAAKIGALTNWNGGDLYILRLSGSTSPIIDDVEGNSGIKINPVIEKALKILDLDDKSLGKLSDEQLDALDKIDDLLAKFDGNAKKQYQLMREVAPDLSKSGLHTAETTAKNVINVVATRFSLPRAQRFSPNGYHGGYYYRRQYGRSGGDYEAGQGAVWAQGLYNHAEQRGKESFSSDSAGFAAGIEAYVSDDFKAGFGYSYASTSIDSDRSDTDVYTHTGFIYAHYQPERFYTNFFAGVGHSSYEDTTEIAKLESDYQTNTVSAQISVGYSAPVLSPEAALRFINTHQKAYTDALGVELKAKSSVAATAVGGFKLSKRYRLRTNTAVSFIPELKAAATYDFARSNSDRTALLPNGASYVVETEKDKRVGAEIGAGFSFGFGNNGFLSLLYDGMLQGKLQSHSVILNAKINL